MLKLSLINAKNSGVFKNKILIFVILLIIGLSQTQYTYAQGSCSNPHIMSIDSNWTRVNFSDSVYWITFQANDTTLYLNNNNYSIDTIPTFSSIVLYSGNCGSLQQIQICNDSSSIVLNGLNSGNTYFLKFNVSDAGYLHLNLCRNVFGIMQTLAIKILHPTDPNSFYPVDHFCNTQAWWPTWPTVPDEYFYGTLICCPGQKISVEVLNPVLRDYSYHCTTTLQDWTYHWWMLNSPPFPAQTNLPGAVGPPQPNPEICTNIPAGTYKLGIRTRFVETHPRTSCIIAYHDAINYYKLIVLDDNAVELNIEPEICVGDNVEFDVPEGYTVKSYSYYPVNNPSNVTGGSYSDLITHFSELIPSCGDYILTIELGPITDASLYGDCGYVTKTAQIHIGLDPEISYTESCYGTPTQFEFSACPGVTNWAWDFGDGHKGDIATVNLGTISASNTYKPNSQYNTYLTVSNGDATCTSSTSVHVNFLPYPDKPEITGNRNNCSSTATYTVSNADPLSYYTWTIKNQYGTFTTNSSGFGLGSVTINWNSSLPVSNPDYEELIVQVRNSNYCVNSDTLQIFQCCQGETIIINAVPYPPFHIDNTSLSSTFPLTSSFGYPGQIIINGDLIADKNFTFENCHYIKFGPQAKIIIQPGFTLTFWGSNLSQECDYMWDGIYVNDPSAKVVLAGSEMKDAINGIVSTYGGSYSIDIAELKNNYVSLQVKDYYAQNGGGNWDPVDGIIKQTTFTNDDTEHLLRIKPYVGKRSKTGILIKRVDDITIGYNANDIVYNTFSYMNNGIIANDADLTVVNNRFISIVNPDVTSNQAFTDAGIAAINTNTFNTQSTVSFAPKLYVGGQGINKNIFQNCKYGVFNYNQKASILYNEFTDCQSGIQLLDSKSPSYVQYNTISKSTPEQYGTGVFAENSILKTSDEIRITNNEITNMQYGIRTVNLRSGKTTIHLNTINYTTSQNPQVFLIKKCGIFSQGSDYISIRDNDITYSGNPASTDIEKKIGIRVTHSRMVTVQNNSLVNAGSGIFTNGNLKNTQFICNYFENCHHGIFFGLYTALSHQGYNYISNIMGFNTHNCFVGDYSQHNKLMAYENNIVNTNTVYWFTYLNYGYSYKLDNPHLGTNYCYNTIQEIENNAAYDICTGYGSNNTAGFDTARRELLLGEILRDENVYNELHEQYAYYDKNHLYYLLLNDTAALALGGTDDDDYIALYDSLRDKNPGIIENFYQMTEEQDYESARIVNEEISPDNIYCDNRKKVNNIYLDSWAKDYCELDSTTVSILNDIANQIPYYAGDAVYTARVMLGINPDDLDLPYNSPITPVTYSQQQFTLYPQPSDKELTVEFNSPVEAGTVINVYDIIGKLIFTATPEVNSNIYYLNTNNLNTGAYIINIRNINGFDQKEKFVVTH